MVAKKKKLFNLLLHNVIPFCACNHLFIDRLLNTLVCFFFMITKQTKSIKQFYRELKGYTGVQ